MRVTPARAAGLIVLAAAGAMLAGLPGAAVSGGAPVPDGTYGFIAKVEVGTVHGCSGALVAPQWVITSGTCFPENAGVAGTPKVAAKATVSGQSVSIVDLLFRSDRNVALAKLAKPVAGVTPVAPGTTAPANNELLRVAGYGRTNADWVPDKPHSATVSVQSSTDTTMAVIGNPQPAAITCQGDAGGPALRERDGTVQLVAIHHSSWQTGCLGSTETRQGGVETRVDNIADWIGQHTRGDAYTALPAMKRILDTRTELGGHNKALTGGESVDIAVPDLPKGASAVAVDLIGTEATASTYLTAYGDEAKGSTLNLAPGRAAAVMAIVPVGVDGKIRVRNNSGSVHAIVDFLGYYSASGESTYQPKDKPDLILDTRTSLGGHQRPVNGGEVVTLPIRGVAGVPSNAVAVAVNITGTESTMENFFTVFAQGSPALSSLNLVKGEDRATQSLVRIGDDGQIRVSLNAGQAHLLVSVVGYFVPGDGGSRFQVLPATNRFYDSRVTAQHGFGPGEIRTVTVPGLPAQATAVALGVVGIAPTGNTFLTLWNPGIAYSGAIPSTINITKGEDTANAATVRLDSQARINIRNAGNAIDALTDLQGYYTR
ncbi:S1 family peptidase [Actinocrispum sp. NPDC049592]|uniref:S1 family peptidase n=1 Tax=Actinocrispum sp. NPDC049592 TaxID=3154835 RepID=UPI003425EA1A